MMRRLFWTAALLTLIFAAAAGFLVAVGRTQPPPSYIATFHLIDCPLPCWIGILPGKTTLREALQDISQTYAGWNITTSGTPLVSSAAMTNIVVTDPAEHIKFTLYILALSPFNTPGKLQLATSNDMIVSQISIIPWHRDLMNIAEMFNFLGEPQNIAYHRVPTTPVIAWFSAEYGSITLKSFNETSTRCAGLSPDEGVALTFSAQPPYTIINVPTFLRPWHGFGKYCDLGQ